jgi:hypothetical protein
MNRYELRLTAAQLEKLIELLHDTSHDIGDEDDWDAPECKLLDDVASQLAKQVSK